MAVNWDACGINNAENLKHGGVRYSFRYFRGGQVRYNGIYNRQQMPKVLLIGDSMPKFYDDKDVDVVSLPGCRALDLRGAYTLLENEYRSYSEIVLWVGGNSYGGGNVMEPEAVVEQIETISHEFAEYYNAPTRVLGLAVRKQPGQYYDLCKRQNELMQLSPNLAYIGVGTKLSGNTVISSEDDIHLSFYGLAGLRKVILDNVLSKYVKIEDLGNFRLGRFAFVGLG